MKEIEMRIEGVGQTGADLAPVEAVLRALDVGATMRLDPATGIVHVATGADTLAVVAALAAAGFTATAMTG